MPTTAASAPFDHQLRCPDDFARLDDRASGARCPSCGKHYLRSGKVVDFLAKANAFYEAKYLNEVHYNPTGWIAELPLWVLLSGYVWAVRREVARGSVVLELGCAAGIRWFGANYRMIGLDFSKVSLDRATVDYVLGLRADALHLPLADGSVDAIVSASFFEHVAPADKPLLVAEMMRVLRPGGKVIFEHDVETDNPLIASFRARDPALYDRLFLEGDGHIGYERHEVNDGYFRAAGFALAWSQSIERLPFQPSDVYGKLSLWGGRGGRLAGIAARITAGILSKPWLAMVRLADVTIGRLAPSSWGRVAITIAQKPE